MNMTQIDTATARTLFVAAQDAKLDVTASRAGALIEGMAKRLAAAGLPTVADGIAAQYAFTGGSPADAARYVFARLADSLYAAHPDLIG